MLRTSPYAANACSHGFARVAIGREHILGGCAGKSAGGGGTGHGNEQQDDSEACRDPVSDRQFRYQRV